MFTFSKKNFAGYNSKLKSPDEINDRISSAIVKSLNELVPKRTSTIHGINAVINPTIQNLKNRKIRIYKKWSKNRTEDNWLELKNISRKLNSAIRKAWKSSLCAGLNKSSRDFWSNTDRHLGRSTREKIEISNNGSLVSNSEELAELFVNFFGKKVSELSQNSNYIPPAVSIPDSSEFFLYSETDVALAIDFLKRSKAQGFDEIPGMVIKDLKVVLIRPLVWLFNSISECCDIPKPWKIIANQFPITDQ